ncbi:nuclear transcription factor Y subunit B-1-like [Ipomoea triloba]|uniref:nuclear transcription factor Y subunit B-1-like n=1 Tax=Ipomoea triloba TaxID=35885 RepID=UPI00125D66AF|nr:nuclear transcription factor Y subunit B-1-like [Ipomoea triloba]XP_031111470.1 nuclear transcription factor Y subunit B-1-like [Ipomoea triloba]
MAENSGPGGFNDDESFREQDRWLPIANVGRIMKKTLPANAKVSKDAKETMQECVSEFIGFVTGEASEKCRKERRKTVNGDDICWAMAALGFDDYAPPLRRYLQRYRDQEGERANQERVSNEEAENINNNQFQEPSSSSYHRSHEDETQEQDFPSSSSSFPMTFKSMSKPY